VRNEVTMKGMNGYLDDTYSTWLKMNCCASLSEAPGRGEY
jgi:hypothetical protein